MVFSQGGVAGYVKDLDGNLPHKQAYENHEGWFLNVVD
jgi:hypothetical protein